jgi:hypothetical protein
MLLITAPGLSAWAQGNGVKSGRFRVRPEVSVEGRFDSNLYREDGTEQPTAVGYMKLLPGLRVENPNPGKVALEASAVLELRQYFNDIISEQQDRVGVQLGAGVELGRGKAVSLRLEEDFSRYLQAGQGMTEVLQKENPGKDLDACASLCSGTFIRNSTGASVKIAPGGGKLSLQPRYRFVLTDYSEIDETDSTVHTFGALLRWDFFPKTAAVVDARIGLLSYPDAYGDVADSTPLRVAGGLRGLISNKLSVDLMGGYGNSMHDSGTSYESFLANAVLTYRMTENLRASAGYARDFAGSPISNFYTSDRFLARLNAQLGGTVNFGANVDVSLRDFGTLPGLAGRADRLVNSTERTDTLVSANALLEWRPNEWFSVAGGYRADVLATDFGARAGAEENFASFNAHQVYTRVGFLM